MARMSLTACFAHFGARANNPRSKWSARNEDGSVVVVTLWKDRISFSNGEIAYSDFDLDNRAWVDWPGNKERTRNLIWARDRCGGFFRAIVIVAKDVRARPRAIADCYPQPRWNMRIVELDELTGELRAAHTP